MENENKQIKASKWVLAILFVLSAVVLVLFFGVGYGNKTNLNNKNLTDPQFTGLLLIWLYSLVGICVASVLGFGIVAGIRNMKTKTSGQRRTGFAGWVFIFTFAILAVSYFLSSATPVRKGDGELVRTVWALQLSDVCLYSIYALVVVSIICTVLSMIGIFKARK